jgi:hypothetical protein
MLLGRVSSDAIAIVLYVVRRTIGYGRDALEAVDGDVAKALGVSLRSFQRAKAELRAARVFEMAAGAGRGKPTVYALTEPETWALPAIYGGQSARRPITRQYGGQSAKPHGFRAGGITRQYWRTMITRQK